LPLRPSNTTAPSNGINVSSQNNDFTQAVGAGGGKERHYPGRRFALAMYCIRISSSGLGWPDIRPLFNIRFPLRIRQKAVKYRISKPDTVYFIYLNRHIGNNCKLECGPMPNVMAALPNIGGALCSTPQSLAEAHYYSAVQ